MPSIELQQKLINFNDRYKINFDVQGMEFSAKIDNTLGEFSFDRKSPSLKNAEIYYKTLTKMIDSSLTALTKISSSSIYDLSNFNLVHFINDFEEIVAQNNLESNPPRERKPYEGMNFAKLVDKVKDGTQKYNQTVYGIWANKIIDKKDKFTYEDLKSVTDRAINSIDTSLNSTRFFDEGAIINLVYAKEAMERVRQSRTGWWKFWHLYDNYQESKYLELLTDKLNEYTREEVPIAGVLEGATKELLSTTYNNLVDTRKDDKEKELSTATKNDVEKREFFDVHKQMKNNFTKLGAKEIITEEIIKALPKYKFSEDLQRSFLNQLVTNDLIESMNTLNKNFDDALKNGETAESQMPKVVAGIFTKAFDLVTTLGYTESKPQFVAAQAITDYMIRKYSAVALEPERLGEFANGHVLNNIDLYKESTGYDSTYPEVVEASEGYKNFQSGEITGFVVPSRKLNNEKREELKIPEANNVNNAPISEPVKPNPPAVEPPVPGNNK